VVSPDGRTLYTPTQSATGCGQIYTGIDLGSGARRGPAFADIGDLTQIAPSPDGGSLAYTTCGPTAGVYVQRTAGTLVTIGGDARVGHLAWSPDSNILAYAFGTPSAIREVPLGRIVFSPRVFRAPDAGCVLTSPQFAEAGLFAVEQCSGHAQLLLFDPISGAQLRSWTLSTAARTEVGDLAIDPAGRWALFSLNTNLEKVQALLLPLTGSTASPRVILDGVSHVAWLPDPGTIPVATTSPPTTRQVLRQSTTVPLHRVTTVPTAPAQTTADTLWIPSCTLGAPTTPDFINGCRRPDGSIQPPP
jgi:hypothetical protein